MQLSYARAPEAIFNSTTVEVQGFTCTRWPLNRTSTLTLLDTVECYCRNSANETHCDEEMPKDLNLTHLEEFGVSFLVLNECPIDLQKNKCFNSSNLDDDVFSTFCVWTLNPYAQKRERLMTVNRDDSCKSIDFADKVSCSVIA